MQKRRVPDLEEAERTVFNTPAHGIFVNAYLSNTGLGWDIAGFSLVQSRYHISHQFERSSNEVMRYVTPLSHQQRKGYLLGT